MNDNKIAVIGDKDSVMLFQALGIQVVYADSAEQIEKSIHSLARENYAVIYITEAAARRAMEAVERYKTQPFPAIILIPDKNGPMGLGMAGIRGNVEKAIGADILFSGDN